MIKLLHDYSLPFNFDNAFVYIKKLTKGSKLRLIFQSINNPWAEKNFGFGGVVSKDFINVF
jgi:hypothetical protein